MSGQQRHREPIDVHLILRRDKEAGAEVLLSRRAGDVYASGLWHLVSGHLDGPHEDVVDALIREAAEEAGVSIDAADVRFAVAVHHRSPGGKARTGMFFEVRTWQGAPKSGNRPCATRWAGFRSTPCRSRWSRTAGPAWTPTGPAR